MFKNQKKNLRSRAWFKLDEIQKKDKLFYPGMTVIDLGSSPGGWSQYIITQIGNKGHIIACDILPMNSIAGVDFFQKDLCEPKSLQNFFDRVGTQKVQVVTSDMSPNISGMPAVDIPKSMNLVNLALEICQKILMPRGSFLVKVFQGEGFDACLHDIRSLFTKVKIRKPDASRVRSREVYIVATGKTL